MNFTFTLNGQEFSNLTSGSIQYRAFSGQGAYRNKPAHQCVTTKGPIPMGRYFIVDRPTGGRLGPILDTLRGKNEWFALFADDGRIDDFTFCAAVERGNFRLHPRGPHGISEGCITLEGRAEFLRLRNHLLSSMKIQVPGTEHQAYGTVIVK
jgi:hypothetical protein